MQKTIQMIDDDILNNENMKEYVINILSILRERENQKLIKKIHEVSRVDFDKEIQNCIEKIDVIRKEIESEQNLSEYSIIFMEHQEEENT